jgi:ribosomal protein L24E
MRYITARKKRKCIFCKEDIGVGEIVIQSEGRFHLMYHEDCHSERFQGSSWHEPRNERPVGE